MDQRARHSRCSRNPFRAGHGFRGYSGSQLLRPVRLLAPQYGPDRSPGQRGLLLPGFQRVGRPSRCWIWLQQRLDSLYGTFFVNEIWQGAAFFFVSFFVRSERPVSSSRPTIPDVVARRSCQGWPPRQLAACSALARPYLDSSEHDDTLGAVRMMTIRGEPACGRGSIAPQPCIRWVRGPEP
jgi:hypothetical protein